MTCHQMLSIPTIFYKSWNASLVICRNCSFVGACYFVVIKVLEYYILCCFLFFYLFCWFIRLWFVRFVFCTLLSLHSNVFSVDDGSVTCFCFGIMSAHCTSVFHCDTFELILFIIVYVMPLLPGPKNWPAVFLNK